MATPSTAVCPKCAREVQDSWRVCPACAARLVNGDQPETETVFTPESSSSSSIEEGRFPAGTVLAGRYRVMGLLGKGGMGEVYRAHDQILNQVVALKFLAHARMDEAALARFRNEVRIARQVSHPNVCRVYDIGAIEGQHFLSMEYLDGEDLNSLIRRIGRLPQDKAIEFTRKICAGLAAAHERGILHRDLKPANIMIDGRGQVRVMDFGLAALAAEIPLSDLRSGTPAYMSPEQKAGKEVTTRSDLFSLGLVLYEMFTGKRRSGEHSSPSEIVKDLDPSVERIILRCLEDEPKRRPSSALNVAMALPGADPIAAALAAGETPSPEMVAASSEKEGFSTRTAVLCFAGVVLAVILEALLVNPVSVLRMAPLNIPPDGLAFRAQDILKQLGYNQTPKSQAYGFDCCGSSDLHFLDRYPIPRRYEVLASHRPAMLQFWYRQHQDEFWADSFSTDLYLTDVIDYNSPANTEPGMIRVYLDTDGRLTALEARPLDPSPAPPVRVGDSQLLPAPPVRVGDSRVGDNAANDVNVSAKPYDWNILFTSAGLDPARFKPSPPREIPPMAFDSRAAWTGTYGEQGSFDGPVHIEAASWEGQPVFFRIFGDWQQPGASSIPLPPLAVQMFEEAFVVLLLAGTVLVARNNLRLGRGDRRGAALLGGFSFLAILCAWALTAAHVASFWELHLLIKALSWAAFGAGLLWSLYLAIEPYVRRNWPDALISWTRLTSGRLRDPLVASHVLAGLVVGAAGNMIWFGAWLLVTRALGPGPATLQGPQSALSLNSVASFSAIQLVWIVTYVIWAAALLLVVVLLRLVVRRMWIAAVLGSIVLALVTSPSSPNIYEYCALALANVLEYCSALWALRRFGWLAALVAFGFWVPWVAPVTSFFAGRALFAYASLAAVATWALWVILSAQRRPGTDTSG